ncbi:MAG: helix-turn-helix domain-containing protein [Myxococcota bacterium]
MSDRQRAVLTKLANARVESRDRVCRAQIILACAEGLTNVAVAEKLQVHEQRVRRWRGRWFAAAERLAEAEDGGANPKEVRELVLSVLDDSPRPGTPVKFSAEQVTQLIALACEPPEDSGLPVTHWTPTELAEEARKRGIVESISPRHLDRLMKSGAASTAQKPLLDDLARQARRR